VGGEDYSLEQVAKQLHKLINVIKIQDLDPREMVDRELVLFKVNAPADRRHEIIEIANVFRAKIVDVGKQSLTIEATGSTEKLAAMEDLLRAYGIKELARTGKIALSRGLREGA
jgi:acetolactate synthase-1/3 small subunit